MNKEEQDRRLAELFRNIETEMPVADTLEEALHKEVFAIHSSLEAALEAKRKNLKHNKSGLRLGDVLRKIGLIADIKHLKPILNSSTNSGKNLN